MLVGISSCLARHDPRHGHLQADITERVWMDIRVGDQEPKRVEIGLYGKAAPLAVSNFRGLIACSKPGAEYCYRDSEFTRVINGFIVQGGWAKVDGTQMKGFEGDSFKDDPGGLELWHDGPGVVQMGNTGPNTNGPSFVIMAGKAKHLDGKHVIFGLVKKGLDHVMAISRLPTQADRPIEGQRVVITDCGIVGADREEL